MSRTPGLVFRLLRSHLGPPRTPGQLCNAMRVSARGNSGVSEHTAKWMTNYEKKSPQELIAEVPPIEVRARIVACEGSRDPALGHPVEYICLDLEEPAPCKYCGLRYVQAHHH